MDAIDEDDWLDDLDAVMASKKRLREIERTEHEISEAQELEDRVCIKYTRFDLK